METGDFLMDGFTQAGMLMELMEKPDGIIAARDEIGIGVIKYLTKRGKKVPEDMAVIGFDNDPMRVACESELNYGVTMYFPNRIKYI